jgi:hypothetical protein
LEKWNDFLGGLLILCFFRFGEDRYYYTRFSSSFLGNCLGGLTLWTDNQPWPREHLPRGVFLLWNFVFIPVNVDAILSSRGVFAVALLMYVYSRHDEAFCVMTTPF